MLTLDIAKIKSSLYDVPMGVSEWKNHGVKYGYWSYFEKSKGIK